MRLPPEQIKAAILDPDHDVRDAAVHYFSDAYRPDPTIIPLVVEAVEKYGLDSAFANYFFLKDLAHTEATIDWLIRKLQKVRRTPSEDETACVDALIQAAPALLQKHEAEIRNLRALDDDDQKAVEQRIRFLTQAPDELWHKLEELCRSLADYQNPKILMEDMASAFRIVEALGRHPEQFAERALKVLLDDDHEPDQWMELFAVRMAGEMQLHAAIPHLVDSLQNEEEEDFDPSESQRALIKLGTEEVVTELARNYPTGDFFYRLSVAQILENIHLDLAVQTACELLKEEEDPELCMALIHAALMQFDPIGIELARDFILNNELDPDVLDLRLALLTACKITQERIPEYDDWLADSESDDDFRLNWFTEGSRDIDLENVEDFGDEPFEEPDDHDDPSRHDEPPITIVRDDARVGRNDPCPCGSGKKFKKCCYGKERLSPEGDPFWP